MSVEGQKFSEILETDLTDWVIGPYHGALPGPMKLRLKLDGEVIASAQVETGFLHRGLEKAMERHVWQGLCTYADRLDPENAVFGELAVALAVESIEGIAVSSRAQAIRLIICELTRIASHLCFIARMARSVGGDTMIHYVLRERERILDLFELLTGARFSLNFLRFGGVVHDVTEGFIERVLEVCELLRLRLKEYNDLLTYNHAFMRRTVGVGEVRSDWAREVRLTGPNARAAGIQNDARKLFPYSGYERLDFHVPLSSGRGDCHERFILRLREVNESLELLRQLAEGVPPGGHAGEYVDRSFSVKPGEAFSRVETPRGTLFCHLVSEGGTHPSRVQFHTPSGPSLDLLPKLLVGALLEDLPVILASLDLSVAEVDR